jgi:hypothetical protein
MMLSGGGKATDTIKSAALAAAGLTGVIAASIGLYYNLKIGKQVSGINKTNRIALWVLVALSGLFFLGGIAPFVMKAV